MSETEKQILSLIEKFGGIDGDHHKLWLLDQIARTILTNEDDYAAWVAQVKSGKDGPDTYEYDVGIPP